MAVESKMLEISEIEEYVILLIHVDDQPIYGRHKLQFLMYMLGGAYKEIRELCNFIINDNGPQSTILDNSIDHLVHIGLLAESGNTIQLTKKCKIYAKEIVTKKNKILKLPGLANIKMPDIFEVQKNIVNNVTIPEMLSFMYCLYPYMQKGSTTYEKLKPDIEEHLFSLLAKEKLSLGRVGQLLGIPSHLVMKEAGKRGLLRLEL